MSEKPDQDRKQGDQDEMEDWSGINNFELDQRPSLRVKRLNGAEERQAKEKNDAVKNEIEDVHFERRGFSAHERDMNQDGDNDEKYGEIDESGGGKNE